MKSKEEIVANWLPRYMGRTLDDFSKYILLTNFDNYVEGFASLYGAPIIGQDKAMPNASAEGISIINFVYGQSERCNHHGSSERHRTGSRLVSRQVRRTKDEEQGR